MQNLKRASGELFKRTPDETFPSLAALADHCEEQRQNAAVYWYPPDRLRTVATDTQHLVLSEAEDMSFELNDWSFGQLCRLAGVEKRTINRLTADTACRLCYPFSAARTGRTGRCLIGEFPFGTALLVGPIRAKSSHRRWISGPLPKEFENSR